MVESYPYIIILNNLDLIRTNNIQQNIKRYPNKNFLIVNAVLTPEQIKEFLKENSITIPSGTYSFPRLSCRLSHCKAYKFIIQNNIQRAIVLEDDFAFPENHDVELQNILSELPDDFDIVKLHHCLWKWGHHASQNDYIKIEDKKYLSQPCPYSSDVGNLISIKGAKVLYQENKIFANVKNDENEAVRRWNLVPNDELLWRLKNNHSFIYFNSIKNIIENIGDMDTASKGPLGSNINPRLNQFICF